MRGDATSQRYAGGRSGINPSMGQDASCAGRLTGENGVVSTHHRPYSHAFYRPKVRSDSWKGLPPRAAMRYQPVAPMCFEGP
jgi:hypothetical protein